jgi:hypothetical protein
MRARHRHFKFGSVENSKLVLDSRYINQSNNTEVSPWADRSGNANDVSQATPANRPTFQTAQQGGNGVVRFDGSNDVLTRNEIGISSPVKATILFYAKRGTGLGGNNLNTMLEVPEYFRIIYADNSTHYPAAGYTYIGFADNGTSTVDPTQGSAVAASIFALCCIIYNGSAASSAANYTFHLDGSSQSVVQGLASLSSLGRGSTVGIGARGTAVQHAVADIGFVGVFGIEMASPLRKRCEHANAFAFKHSCN